MKLITTCYFLPTELQNKSENFLDSDLNCISQCKSYKALFKMFVLFGGTCFCAKPSLLRVVYLAQSCGCPLEVPS